MPEFESAVYVERYDETVPIKIEFAFEAEPNGRPDPTDSFSEGYDLVPELIDIEVLGEMDEAFREEIKVEIMDKNAQDLENYIEGFVAELDYEGWDTYDFDDDDSEGNY